MWAYTVDVHFKFLALGEYSSFTLETENEAFKIHVYTR